MGDRGDLGIGMKATRSKQLTLKAKTDPPIAARAPWKTTRKNIRVLASTLGTSGMFGGKMYVRHER